MRANCAVSKTDPQPGHLRQRRFDPNYVVVPGRLTIVTLRLDDRQMMPVLLNLPVGDALCPNKLDPTNLEPHQVVRVIDHAELIGLSVTDSHGSGNRGERANRICAHRTTIPTGLAAVKRETDQDVCYDEITCP